MTLTYDNSQYIINMEHTEHTCIYIYMITTKSGD